MEIKLKDIEDRIEMLSREKEQSIKAQQQISLSIVRVEARIEELQVIKQRLKT